MSCIKNKFFLAVAVAFFASASSFSGKAFADEEAIEEKNFDIESEKDQVKDIIKSQVLEKLNENLEISGNFNGCFSYGIDSHCKFSKDFSVFDLNYKGTGKNGFQSAFGADFKIGKTFKNAEGKKVFNIAIGAEYDTDDRKIILSSAKGTFADMFFLGYDKEIITSAKGLALGGIFKINPMFTLNVNLMRDLDLKDASISTKNNSVLPVLGIQPQINFEGLGNVKVGGFLRPILLDKEEGKEEKDFKFGYGAGVNADFKFIENVDNLKVNVLFGAGIGEYVGKIKKLAGEYIGEKIAFSFIENTKKENGNDVKELETVKFLNASASYSFKITPENEVNVGAGYFMLFNEKFTKDTTEEQNTFVNKMINASLGYNYHFCEKVSAGLTGNFGMVMTNNDNLFKNKDKENKAPYCWNLVLGVDMKF